MNLLPHFFRARILRLDHIRLNTEKLLIGLCIVLVLILTAIEARAAIEPSAVNLPADNKVLFIMGASYEYLFV
jgi:hypothetical protein